MREHNKKHLGGGRGAMNGIFNKSKVPKRRIYLTITSMNILDMKLILFKRAFQTPIFIGILNKGFMLSHIFTLTHRYYSAGGFSAEGFSAEGFSAGGFSAWGFSAGEFPAVSESSQRSGS